MLKEKETMTDQSDLWKQEIEDLAESNGVKILSMVLGVTKGEAADMLLEDDAGLGKFPDSGFQQFLAIGNVLGVKVETTSRIQPQRSGFRSGVQFEDKFPTVSQWLKDNPTAFGILRAGDHYIYIGIGIVLASSVHSMKHIRVTHMILLGN